MQIYKIKLCASFWQNTCHKCHIIINCATLYLRSTTIFFTQYPIRIAFINIALYSNNQIVVFSKSMLYVTIGNVLSGFCLQQNFIKNLNVRLAMHTTRTFQLYSYLLVRVSAGPNVLKSVLYNATSRLLRHKPFARFSGKKSAATYRGCWSLIVQLSSIAPISKRTHWHALASTHTHTHARAHARTSYRRCIETPQGTVR